MALYRKKPVVIEACRLPMPNEDAQALWDWMERVRYPDHTVRSDGSISITTLEGAMRASPGDWIIRGVKGEFYPCKPDIFDATYEAAT